MEDIMSRLKNWFIQQEWKVIINPDKSVKLSSAFTKRYSTMDAEYFTFLKSFQRVISNDERTQCQSLKKRHENLCHRFNIKFNI